MGESMAEVIFQQIWWAPPVRFRQDIGDDYITFARDLAAPDDTDVAWDLSAPVLMQIKASSTEYLKPKNKRRGEPGWWFAESDTDHFDHWVAFGLPYLLVLVDTTNQIAYWAEVRGPAIEKTGKGRKIWVPASQTVDEGHAEALNQVAVSRRSNDLEGSAWTGRFADLSPADRLRYALVMPRLVAPHGNKSPEVIGYEEAAAMLMRSRFSELNYRAKHQVACPPPEEWAGHKEWGWRFVAALQVLLSTGGCDQFGELAMTARHAFERDLCKVVDACAAYATDRIDDAVALLKPRQNTKPADRGWMLAQASAMLLELDRPNEASKAAQDALFALKALGGDLTVSAIRGGAAAVLYSIAGFGRGDIAETMTAQDNAGSWWRAQDVSWALDKDLKLRFKSWAGDSSTHFLSSTAKSELTTAAWNAAFSGAWGSWRHLSAQIAQLTLTSTSDPTHVAASLGVLVYVGEKSHAKLAASKVWVDGPVDALTAVANLLAVSPWLKRSEGAVMAVLGAAGDLLIEQAADAVIDRVLTTLEQDGGIRRFGGGWSDRWSELHSTLGRVLEAASAKSHKRCAELVIMGFNGFESESATDSLVRIAQRLRLKVLPKTTLAKLVSTATARDDHYGIDLLEVLGSASPGAVAELRRRAEAGSRRAFRSLLVAGSDYYEDYMALGRDAERSVKEMVADARGENGTSKFTMHVHDQVHDLAISAFHTKDNKLWKTLVDAFETGVLPEQQVQEALLMLARRFTDLPPHIQRRLKKLGPDLRASKLGFGFGESNFDSAVAKLNIAAGNVSDDDIESFLLSLRRTDPVGFVTTLQMWNGEHKFAFLSTMALDPDARVRSQAAYSLVEHAHRFADQAAQAASVVRTALALDGGCRMADGVAAGATDYPSPAFDELAKALANHPSAVVRARFSED